MVTYKKIAYSGDKVQVDSAIRDGNGKEISTNYQEKLTSGTNIKTVNGNSLLGSGDVAISGGSSYTAGTGINISSSNVISCSYATNGTFTGIAINTSISVSGSGSSGSSYYTTSNISRSTTAGSIYHRDTGTFASCAITFSNSTGSYSGTHYPSCTFRVSIPSGTSFTSLVGSSYNGNVTLGISCAFGVVGSSGGALMQTYTANVTTSLTNGVMTSSETVIVASSVRSYSGASSVAFITSVST